MTYEFECMNEKCKQRQEQDMPLADFEMYKAGELDIRCKKCKSKVRVVIGTPGVNLGQGFTRRAF